KPFDAFVMAFFAIFGYVALKLDCEPAPLILGFVLGPMMEENLRRALLISRGDPLVFLQEPISLAFLVVAAALLVVIAAPASRLKRGVAQKESPLSPPERSGDPAPDHLRDQREARDRLCRRRRNGYRRDGRGWRHRRGGSGCGGGRPGGPGGALPSTTGGIGFSLRRPPPGAGAPPPPLRPPPPPPPHWVAQAPFVRPP